MQSIPLTETTISNEDHERQTLHMFLGRMLADGGLRDLFLHDPQRAAESLKLSLTSDGIAKLRGYLARLEGVDCAMQRAISAQIASHDRWKQY